MKKFVKIFIGFLILLIIGVIAYFLLKEDEVVKMTDAEKFRKEYNLVSDDNKFVYKELNEILKILEHGTGVVYLGFPECPWCQEYVKYIDEVAKDNNVDEVYYYNVLSIRSANDEVNKSEEVSQDIKDKSEDYLELVSILKENLRYDNEGNHRIYVPTVVVVKDGEILMFDDETAYDTKGYETPQEYWENEDLNALKNKLSEAFNKVKKNICTSGCNE